jgi:hypothetical protein
LLKDSRLDINATETKLSLEYALSRAAFFGHVEVVKALMADKRVDPSANDNFAINWASFGGHIEVVR